VNIIYLIRENDTVWVPVPVHVKNTEMYSRLFGMGGIWDGERHGFNFRVVNTEGGFFDPAQFTFSFDVVCLVSFDSLDKYEYPRQQIFGFLRYPVDNAKNIINNDKATAVLNMAHNVSATRETVLNETRKKAVLPAQTDCNNRAFEPLSFPHKKMLPEKLSAYWRDKLEIELRARKYSKQTRTAYVYYNKLLCRVLQKTPEEIRAEDLSEFLALVEKDREYSASAINLAISAVKFFFRHVLKNESISEQQRPRKDRRLPVVLSKEEIVKIFNMEKNPKHKLLLMLIYSSGLRVSEVVALKKEHIDLSRQVIYIRQGKGRKDRSTMLSQRAAQYLTEYYEFFGIDKWIFPGQDAKKHLTIRSAQNIFNKAVVKGGIEKNISIHGLRHTFATHLLESGTDIRYIQTLLGHANLRTTERYTHVAKRDVLNIKSPLDSIQ